MADPLKELAHDHRELSGVLVAVRDALFRASRGPSKLDDELHEIRDGIEVLREALLDHFAREQEALLPFVAAQLPAERARTDRFVDEHDHIAEVLEALVQELGRIATSDGLARFSASFARFEQLYAAHSKAELAFLSEVEAALASDASAMDQLRALLDET